MGHAPGCEEAEVAGPEVEAGGEGACGRRADRPIMQDPKWATGQSLKC